MEVILRQKRKQQLHSLIGLALLIGLFVLTARWTNFNLWKALMAVPESLSWMVQNFYPTAESFSRLPNILEKLWDTILMSVAATTVAAVGAFLLALVGSHVTNRFRWLAQLARSIASVFRNVPETVWAMIFLFSFSQSLLTGFLALYFVTFGVLTRAFIEAIDEASDESVEALTATGAGFWQLVGQAIIPSVIAQLISWMLYMIETNIRSATLIGILTGTGIGHLFNLYYKSFRYHEAGLIVIMIVLLVFLIEGLSNYIRRAIL